MDIRVQAIRSHKLVGRGSCSTIDECMEDSEIVAALDEEGVATPKAAIKWALDREGLHLEQGLNQRWGEDSDPELKVYNNFQRARNELEDY